MKKTLIVIFILLFSYTISAQENNNSWQQELKKQLQLQGHRNWILVVDAAYPFQSKSAIKTISTNGKQLEVLKYVLDAVKKAPHVYPVVFLDKEINFIPEKEAKGIEAYRNELYNLLKGENVTKELHAELISTIDNAAKTFNILVLKTNLTIPYTSVFIRLDCGYWNSEQEEHLRKLMK